MAETDTDGPPTIEFWFEFASNYSYLSAMRIGDAARGLGVRIVWKPFLLGPILRALGMENSPFILQKEKGAHVWRDMERQCRKYGLPAWSMPSVFPRLSVLPARVALLGVGEDWIDPFRRKVFELNFVQDRDINDRDAVASILHSLDLDASDLFRRAQVEPVKGQLRKQTDDACARGIFGAPTFFVGREMYWGNDRLDDALQFASALTGPCEV